MQLGRGVGDVAGRTARPLTGCRTKSPGSLSYKALWQALNSLSEWESQAKSIIKTLPFLEYNCSESAFKTYRKKSGNGIGLYKISGNSKISHPCTCPSMIHNISVLGYRFDPSQKKLSRKSTIKTVERGVKQVQS